MKEILFLIGSIFVSSNIGYLTNSSYGALDFGICLMLMSFMARDLS